MLKSHFDLANGGIFVK